MLHIKQPYVEELEHEARLICKVEENAQEREIWFSVNKKYKEYLTYEVSDAFLIGLLSYAMRKNHDIRCDAPVSELLLYNIRENLLRVLAKHGDVREPRIIAETIEPNFPKTGFVGTGISCGIDSFHTIAGFADSKYKSINLTHLCINNVGAFNAIYNGAEGGPGQVKMDCYQRSERAAAELGLPLVQSNSNFAQAFPQNHLLTHTFSSMFAVFCLQKMWDYYFYSSGTHDISYFSVKNFLHLPCARYDTLTLASFSTNKLRLFSEGGNLSRMEKIVDVSAFPMAQRYLHVCTRESHNCGHCPKCITTQVVLDMVGRLPQFSEVFNVQEYYSNRNAYIEFVVEQHLLPEDKRDWNYDDEMFSLLRSVIINKMEEKTPLSPFERLIVYK